MITWYWFTPLVFGPSLVLTCIYIEIAAIYTPNLDKLTKCRGQPRSLEFLVLSTKKNLRGLQQSEVRKMEASRGMKIRTRTDGLFLVVATGVVLKYHNRIKTFRMNRFRNSSYSNYRVFKAQLKSYELVKTGDKLREKAVVLVSCGGHLFIMPSYFASTISLISLNLYCSSSGWSYDLMMNHFYLDGCGLFQKDSNPIFNGKGFTEWFCGGWNIFFGFDTRWTLLRDFSPPSSKCQLRKHLYMESHSFTFRYSSRDLMYNHINATEAVLDHGDWYNCFTSLHVCVELTKDTTNGLLARLVLWLQSKTEINRTTMEECNITFLLSYIFRDGKQVTFE